MLRVAETTAGRYVVVNVLTGRIVSKHYRFARLAVWKRRRLARSLNSSIAGIQRSLDKKKGS